jgi:hypothetical protein
MNGETIPKNLTYPLFPLNQKETLKNLMHEINDQLLYSCSIFYCMLGGRIYDSTPLWEESLDRR